MNLESIKRVASKKRRKKRVGRGCGSGRGKTCGRGSKGQKARSGGGTRLGFEGGQMSLIRRLPKKGFSNPFREVFHIVNVGSLNGLEDGSFVDPQRVRSLGLVGKTVGKIKVLGKGALEKKLTVHAHCFSKQAREKIMKAGGEAKEI